MASSGPKPIKTATRIVRRDGAATRQVGVDICVVGAGIAGTSAALEAARLGRKVALVDGLHALGGQAVNSVIGTFCGLFSNGHAGYQLTHGIADGILRDLGAQGALSYRHGGPSNTTVVMYDEVALARWIEERVRASRHHGAARRGDARRQRATGGASGSWSLRPVMAMCASPPPASSMRPAMRRSPGRPGLRAARRPTGRSTAPRWW